MNDKVMEDANHPWQALSTVTTFDRGNTAQTAALVENNYGAQVNGQVVGHIHTLPTLLIESLVQQLCTMFEGDAKCRNKLYYLICQKLRSLRLINDDYNMAEYDSIRVQYQQAWYHFFAIAQAAVNVDNTLQIPNALTMEWSRYHRDFEEIDFIAQGGFGSVFKALNRLDGIEYAIKKIRTSNKNAKFIERYRQEVQILAKMDHANIVSYKCAWIEIVPPDYVATMSSSEWAAQIEELDSEETNRTESDESLNEKSEEESDALDNIGCPSEENIADNESNFDIVFTNDIQNSQSNENSQSNQNNQNNQISQNSESSQSSSDSHLTQDITNNNNSSHDNSCSNRKICQYDPNKNLRYHYILYIQMALCEKTLEQWLKEQNKPTPEPIIDRILNQILCGVDYMHSQNIIHHDIKPNNIFISTSGQIQLGDFGLACPLENWKNHDGLGTHLYAAPEQLAGKCNRKSDIYSIGIVLFELMNPMQTVMEKNSVITDAVQGRIPSTVVRNYPKWTSILQKMIKINPDERPSTSELLHDLYNDKDATIAQLMCDIFEKDNTISAKNSQIQELEKEISLLRKRTI